MGILKNVWTCGATAFAIGLLLGPSQGGSTDARPTKPATAKHTARRAAKPAAPSEYPADYRAPLAYGQDFVEVTGDGVLRGRYRFWGNWDKEFASYEADAKAAAKARGTPCRRVTMGCVFLQDATITLQNVSGGDGKPMTATYSTPQDFRDAMNSQCMKEYSDYMFTWSGGELEVDWVVETLSDMHWVQTGKQTGWGCQPKALGEQVLNALEKYKDRGVCMWMFCAGRPETSNPIADPNNKRKKPQGIGAPPYGISYTVWPLYGGRTLVISRPLIGLMVHEFNHRYLDNLRDLEGVALTRFHGLAAFGFSACGFPEPLDHAAYRFTYQYIIPRGMWRRFTVTTPNTTPKERFSGKAYAWADVKDDCWFRLPDLTDADLAKLTGIPSVKITGDRSAKQDECRAWAVDAGDAAKVSSPYAAQPAEKETALNNILKMQSESCAVLKTATGQWLLVKKELADVYVDMLKISGKGDQPLPVYGYVNRDVLPLLLVKAPAEMAVPACEEGYFRTPRASGHEAK